MATLGLPGQLSVHRVGQYSGDGDSRWGRQSFRGDPWRRADRRDAGGVSRLRAVPAAGVRAAADGADDLPSGRLALLPGAARRGGPVGAGTHLASAGLTALSSL